MRKRIQSEERTSFQEAGDYDPVLDNRSDVAMVYGINESFEKRVAHWREAGYRVHVMTGVSWGGYQDYVRGEWDGTPHYDDAQTAIGGFRLEQGCSRIMVAIKYANNRHIGENNGIQSKAYRRNYPFTISLWSSGEYLRRANIF